MQMVSSMIIIALNEVLVGDHRRDDQSVPSPGLELLSRLPPANCYPLTSSNATRIPPKYGQIIGMFLPEAFRMTGQPREFFLPRFTAQFCLVQVPISLTLL